MSTCRAQRAQRAQQGAVDAMQRCLRVRSPVHHVVDALHVHADDGSWQRQVQAEQRLEGLHHDAAQLARAARVRLRRPAGTEARSGRHGRDSLSAARVCQLLLLPHAVQTAGSQAARTSRLQRSCSAPLRGHLLHAQWPPVLLLQLAVHPDGKSTDLVGNPGSQHRLQLRGRVPRLGSLCGGHGGRQAGNTGSTGSALSSMQ